jgi:hypothetical protein
MKKTAIILSIILMPFVAFGQSLNQIDDVNTLATRIAGIGNIATYMLVAFAVVYIVYYVVVYMIGNGEEKKTEAAKNVGWGIFGLFIIVSLWGLVNILVNTFSTNPNVPEEGWPNADFVSGNGNQMKQTSSYSSQTSQTFQTPSKENNYNTGVTGGNGNTDNYNH